MPALPGPLRLAPSLPFVGRSRELAALRALLPSSDSEGGRVALLGGEPGVGKSRLVRELAHEAAADGVLVLYGGWDARVRAACPPVLPPPPCPPRPPPPRLPPAAPRARRGLSLPPRGSPARAPGPALRGGALGTGGGGLTRLPPAPPLRVGRLPAPAPGDPDTERHRLYTAVADLLTTVSRRHPMLLV